MFETFKDKATAKTVLAQIAEYGGSKARKSFMDILLKNFMIAYLKVSTSRFLHDPDTMLRELKRVYVRIEDAKTLQQKVESYGGSLGVFLAIVRYCFGDPYYYGKLRSKDYTHVCYEIEEYIAKIALVLRSDRHVNYYSLKRTNHGPHYPTRPLRSAVRITVIRGKIKLTSNRLKTITSPHWMLLIKDATTVLLWKPKPPKQAR